MQNLFKGLIVSSVLLSVLLTIFYLIGVKDFWGIAAVICLVLAFSLIGLILGFFGTKIQTLRFLKLFFLGLFLIYVAALLLASAIILSDDTSMIQGFDILAYIFFLGTTGFSIFGMFLLPFLLIGVFVLEWWTRIR